MPRFCFDPLTASQSVAIRSGGAFACQLWSARLAWSCHDAELQAQILAAESLPLPGHEPSESVPGALARLIGALHGTGAVLILLNPAQALGQDRIAYAEGVRCFGIGTEADEACWDAILSLGRPVYGLRGTVHGEVDRITPHAVLSALSYGVFTCSEGLELAQFTEHSHGVSYAVAPGSNAEAAVIVSGGFRARSIAGDAGEWIDQGAERYVRLVITANQGRCWTQPRFIAPRSSHGG